MGHHPRNGRDERGAAFFIVCLLTVMSIGMLGACEFSGTLVSRDEAIIYSGSIEMNYDIRVRDGGYEYIDIFLPRSPTHRRLYFGQGLGEIAGGGADEEDDGTADWPANPVTEFPLPPVVDDPVVTESRGKKK
jgi:hypothetical protein